MSFQKPPDFDERLQQLEADLEQPQPLQNQSTQTQAFSLNQLGQWFSGLSGGGKTIVGVIAVIATLTVLSIILQLISFAIKLALLGLALFFVYKFFFASRTSKR